MYSLLLLIIAGTYAKDNCKAINQYVSPVRKLDIIADAKVTTLSAFICGIWEEVVEDINLNVTCENAYDAVLIAMPNLKQKIIILKPEIKYEQTQIVLLMKNSEIYKVADMYLIESQHFCDLIKEIADVLIHEISVAWAKLSNMNGLNIKDTECNNVVMPLYCKCFWNMVMTEDAHIKDNIIEIEHPNKQMKTKQNIYDVTLLKIIGPSKWTKLNNPKFDLGYMYVLFYHTFCTSQRANITYAMNIAKSKHPSDPLYMFKYATSKTYCSAVKSLFNLAEDNYEYFDLMLHQRQMYYDLQFIDEVINTKLTCNNKTYTDNNFARSLMHYYKKYINGEIDILEYLCKSTKTCDHYSCMYNSLRADNDVYEHFKALVELTISFPNFKDEKECSEYMISIYDGIDLIGHTYVSVVYYKNILIFNELKKAYIQIVE